MDGLRLLSYRPPSKTRSSQAFLLRILGSHFEFRSNFSWHGRSSNIDRREGKGERNGCGDLVEMEPEGGYRFHCADFSFRNVFGVSGQHVLLEGRSGLVILEHYN